MSTSIHDKEQIPVDFNNHLFQYLDTVGDGSGSINMNTAAVAYLLKPPAGITYCVYRLNIMYTDSGALDAAQYGNNITVTNGITIEKMDGADATLTSFTAQTPIQKNIHWVALAGIDVFSIDWGTGDNGLGIRWSIAKSGSPLILNGDNGEYLKFDVRDTLVSLTSQCAIAQGYSVNN